MMELTEIEIKKDLYKSKSKATLSHYVGGNLYYNVVVLGDIYQFPISTIEDTTIEESENGVEFDTIQLSSDLGTTPFYNEMKGSDLNRWIAKAIKSGDFIKIG